MLGAVPSKAGAQFTVWAPDARTIDVVVTQPGLHVTRALSRKRNGCFSGSVPDVADSALYRFRLDGNRHYPDPASRFQPEGIHGPSMFVDPTTFCWTDDGWTGISRDDLTIYELHVGTFTPEGTFAGVESRLDYLASLGIVAIELMPVAEAAGSRNWGYDGVDLFAPSHHYGTPDDLRRLVNAAHRRGLGVILDVVYNHVGPDGAYLSTFSSQYFTDRHPSPWGAGVNLDGDGSEQVRAFLIDNALHWIHEYHVDGLRLDATHALVDDSDTHFLAELADRVRASATRPVVLIAEDERNLVTLVDDPPRGYGFDGVWADDFHHHVRRALAGDAEGYYADFTGAAADIATTLRQGWFYTGQPTVRSGEPRGTDPSAVDPRRMIICIQNHDQIGNRAFGDRLHHAIDLLRARSDLSLTALFGPEHGVRGDAQDMIAVDAARDARSDLPVHSLYGSTLASLSPTPGTRPLLEHMKAEGLVLAVVTSASSEELQTLLRQAEVDDLIDQSTTSSDAAHSKPDPDSVAAAVQRCGIQPIEAIMIGDTPYDVEAASARINASTPVTQPVANSSFGW